MKIAVMQPYFFPYLGYFKLIDSVDIFVFFDDVQYIRRGWINRNKIRIKEPFWLTVPVKKCSIKTLINKVKIDDSWSNETLLTFKTMYGKSVTNHPLFSYYSSLYNYNMLCPMLCDSIKWMSNFLNIKTKFIYSSTIPSEKKRQDRILDICKKLEATHYYNLPGGKDLYDEKTFEKEGIKLEFINTDHYKRISIIESCFDENASNLRF
jgi:hypothetical protein